MQFSSRLTIATHILLCIEIFKDDYKITSNFLAGSIHVKQSKKKKLFFIFMKTQMQIVR